MNFILYIKCTEQEDFSYSNSFLETLRSEIPAADFLDLDNFSEHELIERACKAVELAEKSCLIFQLEKGADAKKFIRLATYLADYPERKLVLVNGKDGVISKLLFPSENSVLHNLPEEEQLILIKKFLE